MSSKIIETPKRLISWNDDAERLILYADIMGFSNKVTKTEHISLKNSLIKLKSTWEAKLKPLRIGDHLRSVQFSDSILLIVNGIDEKMFNLISKAAICLIHSSLRLGFPIKGVLAQGKFTYDKEKELYFGLPLVEAYQLHEEIHYYGIVVHHSAEQTIKRYADSTNPYTKTLVTLKKGNTSHYHLSWHLLRTNLSPGDISKEANNWLDHIEESVSGTPRIYVDNTRSIIKNDNTEWEQSGVVETQ